MDFSDNIQAGKNILGDFIINGKKAGVGKLTITIKDDKTGVYDESDHNVNYETFNTDYDLYYKDSSDILYSYSSSDVNTHFTISINKFDNKEGGELSGKFRGLLESSATNIDGTYDSVIIENGKFSTELDRKTDF